MQQPTKPVITPYNDHRKLCIPLLLVDYWLIDCAKAVMAISNEKRSHVDSVGYLCVKPDI